MAEQSKELTEFYRAYMAWLEKGAPQNSPFSRHDGLCDNVHRRFDDENTEIAIKRELMRQFEENKLHSIVYPFNICSGNYVDEAELGECHLNYLRIQWVKDHING